MASKVKPRIATQEKNYRRIMAWLRDRPFQENLKGAPRVPELSIREILDQYVPPDIKGAGQCFTPTKTATAALETLSLNFNQPLRILVPGAGIGHLILPLNVVRGTATVDAYEIEEECVLIGRKLFPWANWFNQNPFTALADIEGRYDLVLCNPPFGTGRGMEAGKLMCAGRAGRSEYIFLELAIRALKAGGQAVVFGPATYVDRLPRGLRRWLEARTRFDHRLGPLPSATSVELYAHYFTYTVSTALTVVRPAGPGEKDGPVTIDLPPFLPPARKRPTQAHMFPKGEDLPLFSGTAVRGRLAPFSPAPQAACRQLALFEPDRGPEERE